MLNEFHNKIVNALRQQGNTDLLSLYFYMKLKSERDYQAKLGNWIKAYKYYESLPWYKQFFKPFPQLDN